MGADVTLSLLSDGFRRSECSGPVALLFSFLFGSASDLGYLNWTGSPASTSTLLLSVGVVFWMFPPFHFTDCDKPSQHYFTMTMP